MSLEVKEKSGVTDIANVKIAKEKLKAVMSDKKITPQNKKISISKILYEMLTLREEFISYRDIIKLDILRILDSNLSQVNYYREFIDRLEKLINSSKIFSCDSNPGWFGISTSPTTKIKQNNLKIYTTIPIRNFDFIQFIPALARKLQQLSQETQDEIKIKFPLSFSGFIANNDSLVIHFKKKENINKIQEIIKNWLQENDISEGERLFGRTKIAADPENTSFSEAVCENISLWVMENLGKYDEDIIINEAIKYAIAQSQKSPF